MEYPLDVGIVGAGGITSTVHLPILSQLDETRIAYIADVLPEKISKVQHYDTESIDLSDGPSSLPHCDVVVLAIPVGVRQEYMSLLSENDVPVFTEKPFARSQAEHDEFLNSDAVVFCDYMRCCYSTTRQLKSIVNSSLFGTLQSVTLHEESKVSSADVSEKGWQTDASLSGGGVLMEMGCHSLSQLALIFHDWEFELADAQVTYQDSLDSDVCAEFLLQKNSRTVPVDYHVSRVDPIGRTLSLQYEEATLTVDPRNPEDRVSIYSENSDTPITTLGAEPNWATDLKSAFYLRWKQFLSRLRGENTYDAIIETGREITRLTDGIYKTRS